MTVIKLRLHDSVVTTRIRNIAFDAADPVALARWWSRVLGRPLPDGHQPDADEAALDLPDGQTVYFQRVPEPKAVKNRMHICLQADSPRDVETERITSLGATLVADHRNADGSGWVVLADPEGNEFCVLRSVAERGF
ncbi:VOC family protein [Planotetraspora kaengkrachanensis]|uniref:Glyoxalase n=1 Tax=Planotetraspora kaengkrachanensis TaxID=575193 RepID=A0A8J3PQV6_9ACTN|nr:VOC family protein [Planotetraspora kaengkrachanensis]GIG78497.1 glyoxalase [Planotetraspora kaengkrachanensis]